MWSSALIGPLILVVSIITLTVGIFDGSISNVLGSMARDIGAVLVFSGSIVGMASSKERFVRTATKEPFQHDPSHDIEN